MGRLKIVYDVDDTLWGLNDVVYGKMEIPADMAVTFNCTDNPNLSEQQALDMLALYKDPHTYQLCEFYSGIERVFSADASGDAEVWICSSCHNPAIAFVKNIRLSKEVPHSRPEHFYFDTDGKHFRVPGDVLVDDRLKNITESDFRYNILIDKPYNRKDVSLPDGHILVRVSSLNEAVDEVEKIIISEYAKDRNFQPGDIVRHFKQQYVQDGSKKHYYRYLGTALHTETKEILAIYQMLFPDSEGVRKTFARPMHMFAEPVDVDKYPDALQSYRLEKVPAFVAY